MTKTLLRILAVLSLATLAGFVMWLSFTIALQVRLYFLLGF
ncbi:hypothetical protein ES708_18860 [subsurface metagenome]